MTAATPYICTYPVIANGRYCKPERVFYTNAAPAAAWRTPTSAEMAQDALDRTRDDPPYNLTVA